MRTYVYFLSNGTHVKIGKTKNLWTRMHTLQTGQSEKLFYIAVIEYRDEKSAYRKEALLHKCFEKLRLQGEWSPCQ